MASKAVSIPAMRPVLVSKKEVAADAGTRVDWGFFIEWGLIEGLHRAAVNQMSTAAGKFFIDAKLPNRPRFFHTESDLRIERTF